MSAIWHEPSGPLWLSGGPQFSFVDVAEIIAPCPESYAEARAQMQRWERRLGAAWYQHNAQRAYETWQLKRPWWLF